MNEDYTVYNSTLIDDIFKGYGFYNVYEETKDVAIKTLVKVMEDKSVYVSFQTLKFQ